MAYSYSFLIIPCSAENSLKRCIFVYVYSGLKQYFIEENRLLLDLSLVNKLTSYLRALLCFRKHSAGERYQDSKKLYWSKYIPYVRDIVDVMLKFFPYLFFSNILTTTTFLANFCIFKVLYNFGNIFF